MPAKDQVIKVEGEKITILRKKFGVLAFTSFSEEIYESLRQTTWTPSEGYMRSQKYGSLHKHVMALKYGEDVIKEAYESDFVIDHINNNGFDCVYTNLEIIPRKLNSAKGLTYDEERKKYIDFFALNFSKDEDTNEFQIGIGFNKPIDIVVNGEKSPLASIYFRYGKDYKTTFLEAHSILNELVKTKSLKLTNLSAERILIKPAEGLKLSEGESLKIGFIMRDSRVNIIQGSSHARIVQVPHNKDLHKE